MSKSIRSEHDRRISELESLVAGLSAEVTRLINLVDKCERHMTTVILTLDRLTNQLKGKQ
jgi:uncharacterized coiled-coil protein SlyX